MKVYREGVVMHDLAIDDKTTIKRRLMVENSLNLSVAVARSQPLDLKIGDYTDIGAERYIIMDDPTYSLRNGVYDYDVLMRGNLHRLEVYMMPDEGRDEWFYYGSVVDQINKVVAILNTKEVGWSVVLPNIAQLSNISPKNINYANMSILSAFHAICNAENGWGLEFDVVGKTIVFGKEIKNPTQMRFEYGKGKGLYELSRGKMSGEKISTRIIGYGGIANMPNGQRLDFASVNGGDNYIDKNVDKYGLRETRVNFDHIYPRLKDATIIANAVQVQAGKANWTVKTTLDFDLTQQVLDESVIVFQTGDCAGVEFKIVAYDHTTKTITFAEDADESGVEVYVLPNSERYPKAGDQYVLINILMPDSYVVNAKNELKAATIAEADRIAIPQRSYSVKCDPRYFKVLGVAPLVGDGVRIIDTPHGVDYVSRIIEINYPVIYPHNIEMVLADKIPIPSSVVMAKSIKEVKTKMAMLDKGNITEAYLRKIFHPKGGGGNLDFQAKDILAKLVEAESVNAEVVKASQKVVTDEIGSENFAEGVVISGFKIWLEDGKSRAMFNKLKVDELIVDLLTIQKVQAIGGVLILTPAYANITRVENLGSAFKCYYKPDVSAQMWIVGDQALCKNRGKYYWRLVTSVSDVADANGEFSLNLSVATANGSGVPTEGDEIVLLGHRGAQVDRTNALILSSGVLGYSNPFTYYQGITTFSLEGKEMFVIGQKTKFKCHEFSIIAPDGTVARTARECGAWVLGKRYYYFDRVSHNGSVWLCVLDNGATGTTVAPADGVESIWLCEVRKGNDGQQGATGADGDKGDKGDKGDPAPVLKTQFSVNGSTAWHTTYAEGDKYRRESNDNGTTWSGAMRMWGETGATGVDGKKTPYTDFSYGYGLSQPTSWSDTPPTKVEGQHLWERIQKYTVKADNSGWTLASTSYAIINEYIEIGTINLLNNSAEFFSGPGNVVGNAEIVPNNVYVPNSIKAGKSYCFYAEFTELGGLYIPGVGIVSFGEVFTATRNVDKILVRVPTGVTFRQTKRMALYETTKPINNWVPSKYDSGRALRNLFVNARDFYVGPNTSGNLLPPATSIPIDSLTTMSAVVYMLNNRNISPNFVYIRRYDNRWFIYDFGEPFALYGINAFYLNSQIGITGYSDVVMTTDITFQGDCYIAAPEDVQAEIDGAKSDIADIFSDGKITPDEKQQLKLRFNSVTAIHNENVSKASTIGVSTASLVTLYNHLNAYVSPFFINMTTTEAGSFTIINDRFNAWEVENAKVNNAISQKQADIAVDGIEVGGMNLLKNSKNGEGLFHSTYKDHSTPSYTVYGAQSTTAYIDLGNILVGSTKAGQTYTYSFTAWTTTPQFPNVCIYLYNKNSNVFIKTSQGYTGRSGDGVAPFTLTTVQTRYWVTWTEVEDCAHKHLILMRVLPMNNAFICLPKFELGNKATDWSPAPEDVAADAESKKLDAICSFFGGSADRATIEAIMNGTGAPFEVKGNTVYMREAFVQKLATMESFIDKLTANTAFIKSLVVNSLKTQKGNIQLDDTIAKLGNAYVDTGGNYAIKDSPNGDPLVLLTKESLTPLSDFTGQGASGETTVGSRTQTATTSWQKVGNSLNVTKNNSKLTISGSLSGFVQCETTGQSINMVTTIALFKGGSEYSTIRRLQLYTTSQVRTSETQPIEVVLTVPAGSYDMWISTEMVKTSDGITAAPFGSATASIKLRFDFVSTILRSELARDGLAVIANSSNYLHASYNRTSGALNVVGKGSFDMPNIALVGYDVTYNGSITNRFGAKARPQGNATYLGNGKYQIPHDIGHSEYNVIPVITGGDDNSTSIAREINTLRTTNSCVIRLTNLNNQGIQVPFTVTIFGKN